MEKIEVVAVVTMPESNFIKPCTANGIHSEWVSQSMGLGEVTGLCYHTSVQQESKCICVCETISSSSPLGTFYNHVTALNKNSMNTVQWDEFPAKLGITMELCSGILDNPQLTEREIAKQEVFEECGYDVPLENLKCMTKCRAGIGDSESFYYAEVADEMRVNQGRKL